MEPIHWAEYINPAIKARNAAAAEYAHQNKGVNDLLDNQWEFAETAYQIGMLAGAILTGCPREAIDRLERGLAHATAARHWNVTD